MEAFCVSENLDELKKAMFQKQIFSKSVENSTLLIIFEILWNMSRGKKKCKDSFSNKSLRGLKKFKTVIRTLLNKKKSLEKRKKKFLKAPSVFKKFIKRILKEFVANCCEET